MRLSRSRPSNHLAQCLETLCARRSIGNAATPSSSARSARSFMKKSAAARSTRHPRLTWAPPLRFRTMGWSCTNAGEVPLFRQSRLVPIRIDGPFRKSDRKFYSDAYRPPWARKARRNRWGPRSLARKQQWPEAHARGRFLNLTRLQYVHNGSIWNEFLPRRKALPRHGFSNATIADIRKLGSREGPSF
jgi:hypothetical protein